MVRKGVLDHLHAARRELARRSAAGLPIPATACTGRPRKAPSAPASPRAIEPHGLGCDTSCMRSAPAGSTLRASEACSARSPFTTTRSARARARGRFAQGTRGQQPAVAEAAGCRRSRRSAQSRARRRCCSPSSHEDDLGAAARRACARAATRSARHHGRRTRCGARAAAAHRRRRASLESSPHHARRAPGGDRSRARRCPLCSPARAQLSREPDGERGLAGATDGEVADDHDRARRRARWRSQPGAYAPRRAAPSCPVHPAERRRAARGPRRPPYQSSLSRCYRTAALLSRRTAGGAAARTGRRAPSSCRVRAALDDHCRHRAR